MVQLATKDTDYALDIVQDAMLVLSLIQTKNVKHTHAKINFFAMNT